MNALVIGASDETVYAIKKAQEKGMTVFAFDGNENAEGLKYSDESYVVDIRNPQNIFDIIDKKNFDSRNMVVLPVPIGRYLISSGAVNDHYHLTGASGRTTDICTDKWLFHQMLQRRGLRNISCHLLKNWGGGFEEIPFPSIVKPRYGAGSRQVMRLSSLEEWRKFERNVPYDEDFLLEDSVEGTEYGVDGMVINGVFHLVLARKKLLTPPPYRQCVGYISVKRDSCNENLIERMEMFMHQLVEAVGLTDGILHADIIDDGSRLFVIEMSPRPSGHRLHDLFTPMVTGVDMVSEFIDHVTVGRCNIEPKSTGETYLIRYFDIESDVVRIPEPEKIYEKYHPVQYECNLHIGGQDKVRDGHSLMNRGFFILKGTDEKRICDEADRLLKEYV